MDKTKRIFGEIIEKIESDYKSDFLIGDDIDTLTIHEALGNQAQGNRTPFF